MVLFNHATREMTAKIVYYGPGLCGKTTNLMVIFDKLDPKDRGKMLSLATKSDRTLFFDLLPVDVGKIGAFNLKIQLYTVPGQVFYNETRKLVLKGADAVVFVADSQASMVESNRESFDNLMENLRENEIDTNDIPIVIQYNKRDIPGVLPVEDLEEKLGFEGYPWKEASALRGDGVMETFALVSKIAAKHLIGKLQGKPAGKAKEKEKHEKKSKTRHATQEAPAPKRVEPAAPPPPEENPFASSFGGEEASPFGETPFPAADYEKVEEVSLDQLLEGRERPATISGDVAIPVHDDVEPIDEAAMLADELPVAVAIEEPEARRAPAPAARAMPSGGGEAAEALRLEIAGLKADIAALRQDYTELKELLREGFGGLGRKF
jgi:signal recognition particle receptor subunit beta